jgi:type I restriction enzyme S subunit
MASVGTLSGRLDPSDHRLWHEVKKGYTKFQDGDVLFAKITPCMENGKAALATGLASGIGAGSTEFHILRPGPAISPVLLLHYVLQEEFRRSARAQMTGTAGQLRVPTRFFEEQSIPVPPLPEQLRIVAAIESYFTRLDDAVATLERVQRNLKRYRASVLKAAVEGRLVPTEAELARAEGRDYEPASVLLERILTERRRRWEEADLAKMHAKGITPKDGKWKAKYEEPLTADSDAGDAPILPEGWRWTTIDALCWDGGYGTSRKCGTDASGSPVLRIPNIQNETLTFDDLKFTIGEEDLPPDGVLKPGDFVFIRTNGSKSLLGRGALVVSSLPRDFFFASYLIRLRLALASTTAKWFALVWHVPVVRDQLLRDAASSAGQHNVSLSAAKRYFVPIPPLAEQERILAEVERLLSVADSAHSGVCPVITRAASLRQSILKWAFQGRLVDQDPTDEPASVLLERIRAERASLADKPPRRARKARAPIS